MKMPRQLGAEAIVIVANARFSRVSPLSSWTKRRTYLFDCRTPDA